MLQFLHRIFLSAFSVLLLIAPDYAGKLAIVIDDFGYRLRNENQMLTMMPQAISIAVLPNAPNARKIATKAHNSGHEVLIHLPMAPLSKKPLEKDTICPEMSNGEIERIVNDAYSKVPFAVGLNNHMGSAMTSSLFGMHKLMQVLAHYNFYFLDSVTISNSKSVHAAQGTGVKVIKRKVFLDDRQNEINIRSQFNRAIQLAQRNGSAIAIGHPYSSTTLVLQQMIPTLPADITLVRPSELLSKSQMKTSCPISATICSSPRNLFRGVILCELKRQPEKVYTTLFFTVIRESIIQSTIWQYFQNKWQGLGKCSNNQGK